MLAPNATSTIWSTPAGASARTRSMSPSPVRTTASAPARPPVTYPVHPPRAIAMGNDAGIRHAIAEGILALLDLTGIDARHGHANPHFARAGGRVGQLPEHEHVPRRPLLLVPCGSHRMILIP